MKGVFMDKSVQLFRFKITPPNDVLLTDSHQHEQGSLFIKNDALIISFILNKIFKCLLKILFSQKNVGPFYG